MAGIGLRQVGPADEPLIEAWIRLPDVQRWWGDADSAFAEVRLALESPSAMCRIIEVDGAPAGYAQALDAALRGSELPQGLPAGTWDIDLFVAETRHRGRGVGQRALQLLVEEVFSTTLAVAVSVFVSVRNEAAVRAYERAGFQWVRIWDDPIDGAMWMMLRMR